MTTVIDTISDLLSRLQSPDFYEREEAVRELGNYQEDEAVAGLVMAIEDPDLGIRELAADLLSDMKGDIASQLLIHFLGSEDIGTRNLAAEILVKIGYDAVQPLIDDRQNDDDDIRKFLADVLGLIKDERCVPALCEMLTDENINVIGSAAEALGELGDFRAVQPLLETFHRKEDARLQAVEALGKCGNAETLGSLYELMETDDPMVLFVVLEAIGRIGEADAVPRLLKFLDDEEQTISETALLAIIDISIANNGRLDYDLPMDRFSDFLFQGMRSGNKKITDFTLSRLKSWHGQDVSRNLIEVIDAVGDSEKARIAEALEESGPASMNAILECFTDVRTETKLILLDIIRQHIDDQLAPKLVARASDTDPEVRQKIARTLGIAGWSGAVECLKKLAGDENGHVRGAAYAALGWLTEDSEIDFLLKGLDDPYSDVQEAAMGALIVCGGDIAVEHLTRDLNHEDVDRQRLVVNGLGLIGDTTVIKPLVEALNHPEASIRKSAILALGRIGDIEDDRPLVQTLSDENSAVRKAAMSALLAVKGKDAVPDIRFLLDDEDIWVQYHAINSIGEAGQKEHVELIVPFLESETDILKIAATKAVTLLDVDSARKSLEKLSKDKNEDVVQAAEMALSSSEGAK